MSIDPRRYYAAHGPLSDPGQNAGLYDGLPDDLPSLVKIVQHNLVHIFWAERCGRKLTQAEQFPVTVRDMASKLALIRAGDPRPLLEPRPLAGRLVGNCRDFSLALVSILRHQGRPARARCGFGAYFLPDHLEDHWVCEYWNAGQNRWVMVDAQLDEFQQRQLNLDFDPLDTPRHRFIVAGQAWQMCRSGEYAWEKCGIFDMHGLWFVLGNLVRDALSLNKLELLPWDDGWGLLANLRQDLTEADVEIDLFDRLAVLTQAGNEAFSELLRLYESEPRLPVPEAWLAAAGAWPPAEM